MTTDSRLDVLIAKDEIRDVLHGYALAADRGDLQKLAQFYHPDATDERAYNEGTTLASFLETLEEKLKAVRFVQHHISNIVIKIEGDYAESECFVSTSTIVEGDGGPYAYNSSARYLDKMERRDCVWKIAHRRVVSTWARTTDDVANEAVERAASDGMLSRIGPDDPSYAFFRLFRRGER